jgi:hypothetical protein
MGSPQEPDAPVEPADEEVPDPEHNTILDSAPKPQ